MGAIVGAGINAVSTIAAANINREAQKDTNKTNLQIGREVNASNERLAREQNDWNKMMWDEQNKYNDPSKQVERLTGAGLSQAAAAQSIDGAGNAGAIQSADLANQQMPASMQAPQFDISAIPSVLGAMRQLVDIRKAEAETKIEQTKADNADMVVLTPLEAQQAATKLNLQMYTQKAKEFPYSLRKLQYEAKSAKYLPHIQKAALNQAKVNYDLAKQQYGFLDKFNNEQLRKIGEEINGIIQHAEKERQDIAESKSRQGLLGAQQGLVSEQTNTQKEETTAKKIQNCLERHGMPSGFTQRLVAMNEEGILPDNKMWPYVYSIASYVRSFGQVFESAPELRSVFINELQPGIGSDAKRNVWSIGTGTEVPYMLKQAWKNWKNITR